VKYLLDTCVVSELVNKIPDRSVVEWVDEQDSDYLHLSVVTIGEIQRGICKLGNSPRALKLQDWLNDDLIVKFDRRIIPIDVSVMEGWGRLMAGLNTMGLSLPIMDSLVAATAIAHGFTLVTRNIKDFENSGIKLHNPWM
jgi:toxin FitB